MRKSILSWKVKEKSWKMGKKVLEIENILKKLWIHMDKSWNFSTAVIWLWDYFALCSRFKIVMWGWRQTIFSTPYFPFEKMFDFLFVCVMNTCRWSSAFAFSAIIQNNVNCHGKKSWNLIIRFLWEPCKITLSPSLLVDGIACHLQYWLFVSFYIVSISLTIDQRMQSY